MASYELELVYREVLQWATETIERSLFGSVNPAEHQLRTPKQVILLSEADAQDLVRHLAHISVVPGRPAHVWHSPPGASDLTGNLLGEWGKSSLDPDPLPDEFLEPDNPLDQPSALERALDHLEGLRDLSERHLLEKSRAKARDALTRLRGLFLDALPSDSLNIGRVNTRRRGAWVREAADLIRQAVAEAAPTSGSASAAEPLTADELGHLLADLLDCLTPAEPVTDPTSVARLLRKWK